MIKKYNIKVNGNIYDVEVEELGAQIVNTANTQISSKPQQKIQKNTQENGIIKAPMPGTINNVLINVGDIVKKGQVLLILEAMKMENEIMANCDGTILDIHISKGSSVSVGDELITIG